MSEKIRALRKTLESAGGRNQPQAASQQAYGQSHEHWITLGVSSDDVDAARGKKARTQHPIIMISSSPTALITMWNVKKFLEQGM